MHTLRRKQKLPITLDKSWQFFSCPKNLKIITPEHMGFEITSEPEEGEMYAGQIITYVVKPLLGIPMKWVTEIVQVSKPGFFIDQQLSGPYAYWHHQHFFKECEGGTEVIDVVHYKLHGFIFGELINKFYVQHQLKDIFDFRERKLTELFGKV